MAVPSRTQLKAPVEVPLGELRQHPGNPRRISDVRLEHLQRTLTAERAMLGARPLIALPDGTVIAGNQRLAAAVALGWESIPVVYADLDEGQAARWMLLDNRGFGEDDPELLAGMLRDLDSSGTDLAGYLPEDVDAILRAAQPVSPQDPDAAPPLPAEARSVRGAVYELGPHRVMCGDSTDQGDVEALVGREPPSAAVTDPPYGIGYEYSTHDDAPLANAGLVEAAFALAPECLIWTPGKMNLARDIARFGKCSVVIWHKGFAQAGNGLGGASTWEPILVRAPRRRNLPDDVVRLGTDRVSVGGVDLRELHTCPKPVKLYGHLIDALTARNDTIFDPFAGSGTTLIAAETTGRRCFAMEFDPGYCDVIRQRYADYTDQPQYAP